MFESEKLAAELVKMALSKAGSKFRGPMINILTGKSTQIQEAEDQVAKEKILTIWDIEKPFYEEAEKAAMQRKYSNALSTAKKALPYITATENKISDDNDIFRGLFDHSKEISNDEMQDLIAKIIAGEYNAPGTYSMSTLQTIKMLDAKTLKAFEGTCSLVVNHDKIPAELFAFNKDANKFLPQVGVSYDDILEQQSFGLLAPGMLGQKYTVEKNQHIRLRYFHREIVFRLSTTEAEGAIEVQTPDLHCLTSSGKQIAQHLNPQYNDEYFAWLQKYYQMANCEIVKEDSA